MSENNKIDNALQRLLGLSLEVEKIWENARPNDSFTEQEIALDFNSYDCIIIIADYKTRNGYLKAFIVQIASNSILDFTYGNGAAIVAHYRSVTAKTGGITFHSGWISTINTDSKDNTVVIPFAIYGIKYLGGALHKIKKFFAALPFYKKEVF